MNTTPAQLPLDVLKADLDAITQIYEQRRLLPTENMQPSVRLIWGAYLGALEACTTFLKSLYDFFLSRA